MVARRSSRDYLSELAERQLLLASATTELGVGGDVRTSVCTVERDDARRDPPRKDGPRHLVRRVRGRDPGHRSA